MSLESTPERELIPWEILERVTPILKNAAHPLRLRILDYLDQENRPCNVGEIRVACEADQAIVSQQLRILKDQGILASRREGVTVYYGVANQGILLLLDCIRTHKK